MGKLVTPADVLRSANASVSGTSIVSLTSLGGLTAIGVDASGSGDVSQVPRWTVTGNVTATQGTSSARDLRNDVANYQAGDIFSFPSGLPSGWSLEVDGYTLDYDGVGPVVTQLTDFSVQRPTFLPDVVSRVIATIVVEQVRPDAFGILKNDLFASQVSPYSVVLTTLPVGANPPVVLIADDGSISIDATGADVGNYFAEYLLSESSIPALNNPGRIDIDVTNFAALPYLDAIREFAYEGIGDAVVAANQIIPESRQRGTGTIWEGSSLIHRLAARGRVDIGAAREAYGFNGDRDGLEYNNAVERSTQYVKWECAFDPASPNNFYVCTTAGVTGAVAPIFDTTTGEVSTTSDGTVVWTYGGNVVLDHLGNTNDWKDTGNGSQDVFLDRFLGNNDTYFYDLAATAMTWRRYMFERGFGTQDELDALDWVAGVMIAHERERNRAPAYRNNSSTSIPATGQEQIVPLSQGWAEDFLAPGTRYKGRGLTTVDDMQGYVVTGTFSQNNNQGNADLSTITTLEFTASSYVNPNTSGTGVLKESTIREVSYMLKHWANFKRCEFEDTSALAWPTVTVAGDITTPVPLPQFFISLLFTHMHKAMNGTYETSNGWAPFMKGVLAKSIIDYYKLMQDAGQDPDQYVTSADMGGEYDNLLWSDSAPHGICQPWPTIAAAFQDFFYWMRYTATEDGSSTLMWNGAIKGFRYRARDAYNAADLGGLYSIAYYFIAKMVKDGAPIVPGTHAAFTDWLTDADEMWEGMIENYGWYQTGKPANQFLSYAVDMIDLRNEVTGRSD